MKAYGIFPAFDLNDAKDPRVQACITLVAEIVVERLRSGGDHFHFAMDWRDPGAAPWQGCTDAVAEPHLVSLSDLAELRQMVWMSVDPFSPGSANVIRSAANCRAATFGFDGQAFLCLRHEDAPPASSDLKLVIVEERTELLESDYFDGWMGGVATRLE